MSEAGEVEDRLYGLLEVAERQQAAAQAALEGMAAERAALKRERDALAAEAKALGLSLRTEVHSAVTDGLAAAATEGVQAVQTATAPLLGRLEGVAATARQAEAALRRVVLWASWRLLGWVMAGVAVLVLLIWLSSTVTLWRATDAIASAQARKAQLEAEVAEMQANRDAWAKAGMLGKLERCDPGNRPCIRVDERAGAYGTPADRRVILGY
jgi:cell division protein FtsB